MDHKKKVPLTERVGIILGTILVAWLMITGLVVGTIKLLQWVF